MSTNSGAMDVRAERLVVDGRVFGTEASERGMGRYVEHLITAFAAAGYQVVVLVLAAGDLLPARLPPSARIREIQTDDDPLRFTALLNRLLVEERADAYLDGTPFLPPVRYDIFACPVIAVIYDLIPMRYPGDYFGAAREGLHAYINGMARVKKADALIAISQLAKRHALTYLGVPGARAHVVQPPVAPEYILRAERPVRANADAPLVCIQGAHRSKSFPRAIPFLERLARRSGRAIDVIVPTISQSIAVEGARSDAGAPLRISASLAEQDKQLLQARSLAALHLSLEEGYGIPLIEALFLHKPIVCLGTEINRELLGLAGPECASAGVLMLDDLSLQAKETVERTALFVASAAHDQNFIERRAPLLRRLIELQIRAPSAAAAVLETAKRGFADWHAKLGVSIASPTEFARCGVSDYSLSLMRGTTQTRYVFLLGPAPQELELLTQTRLLPLDLLPLARPHLSGVLFHLAVSESLLRGFDAIATQSAEEDALIVHDAGSYLPGILMHAASTGDYRPVFARYLKGEESDLRMLSMSWLNAPTTHAALSEQIFLELDRNYRSAWLRAFRGRMVSHHPVFDCPPGNDGPEAGLTLLHPESEIRRRTRYLPMPIDARSNPAVFRFGQKIRWALGLSTHDVLLTCAGSIVCGKYLEQLARVVCRVSCPPASSGAGRLVLLLAGRVLEPDVMSSVRSAFESAGLLDRLLQFFESDESRFDSMLAASDVVVAFREQRRIQMSHSLVRALALGRPVITNEKSGFSSNAGVVVCRDDALESDLQCQVERLARSASARKEQSREAYRRYQNVHTVPAFFERLSPNNA